MVDPINDPSSKIDLYIKCRNLKNLGTFGAGIIGTSDPLVIVSEFDKKQKIWVKVAQTACAKNDLNPDFQPVELKYYFERKQLLQI